MATDGLTLYATITELQNVIDARIDKIQQPDKDILLLHLHGSGCGRVKLLININNENGRIHLTENSFENPVKAPAFCMLLRKYLIGARITGFNQVGFDRIAKIALIGRNDLDDELPFSLVIELMGRHGNLFLLDSAGMILDCMRHFGPGEDALRICLPNCEYVEPPCQEKAHPFLLTAQQLTAFAAGRLPSAWLSEHALGISRLCAQQIVPIDTPADQIGESCYAVLQGIRQGCFTPSLLPGRGVLPFAPRNAEYQVFPSMSLVQEAFYKLRDAEAVLHAKKSAIRSTIERAYKRVSKKLELFLLQSDNDDSIEKNRRFGELLTVNFGNARVIDQNAVVWDYYQDPPVEVKVPLDRKKTIAQNAQMYFKRYRKEKNAASYAKSQVVLLRDEQEYLEGLLITLDTASSSEELFELKTELIEQHYLKKDPGSDKRAQSGLLKSDPIRYRAEDGTIIRVGRNNLQNDRLLKTESPDFTWLHAKNMPASHVYIECASPSKETLLLAAEIAALHSKGSKSAQVPIDYTLHRYVKKPSGARPGFVNYFNQHTIYVTPDSEKLSAYRIH